MPNSVTSIGDCAFEDCTGLTSITIPESITSIGAYLFDDCNNLTGIKFDDTTTWYIGDTKGATTTQISVTDNYTNVINFKNRYPDKYWTKK